MHEQDNMEEALNTNRSIGILRDKSIKLLSNMLNPIKFVRTKEGLPRYWKGLAELCCIETYLISNLEYNSDPTREMLRIWQDKGREATIQQLLSHLEKLDRFDIIDDICPLIVDDIHFNNQHLDNYKTETSYYPDLDKWTLTIEDEKYDAFVLFADDDVEFAKEVIETMENQYNLKLCVKDRVLFGGTFEHKAIIKLISERCEKLIVILSPSFFSSAMNKFFLNFTQAISLEKRKIIPCLYKQCPDMPPEIRCYFMLDYTRTRVLCNFWDKLYESITMKRAPSNASNRITDTRLIPSCSSVESNTVEGLIKPNIHQIPTASLPPTPITTSLVKDNYQEPEKKTKQKTNWFLKFRHKYDSNQYIDINGDVVHQKEKKRFWNRHRKTKEQIATT